LVVGGIAVGLLIVDNRVTHSRNRADIGLGLGRKPTDRELGHLRGQRRLKLQVVADSCSVDPSDTRKAIDTVDVREAARSVRVTVWIRKRVYNGICAGVGLIFPTTVKLSKPLGNRALILVGDDGKTRTPISHEG
jgi:hypothetical protein